MLIFEEFKLKCDNNKNCVYDEGNSLNILYMGLGKRLTAIKQFKDACKAGGVNFFIATPSGTIKTVNDDVYYNYSGKDIRLDNKNTVVILEQNNNADFGNILTLMTNGKFSIVNSESVRKQCNDMYRGFRVLRAKNVSIVPSIHIDRNDVEKNKLDDKNKLEDFLEENLFKTFPISVRATSKYIIDKIKCEDLDQLCSSISYFMTQTDSIIIQPDLTFESEQKVQVICKDFMPEYTSGISDYMIVGSDKSGKISDDEAELALKTAFSMKSSWIEVTIGREVKTKKVYTTNISSKPNVKDRVCVEKGKTIPGIIVDCFKNNFSGDHVKKQSDMISNRNVVSYMEAVELVGLGVVRGRFDTGNSCLTELKSNVFEINGDQLTFEVLVRSTLRRSSGTLRSYTEAWNQTSVR